MNEVLNQQLDPEAVILAFRKMAETGEPVDPQIQNLRGVNFLGKDLSGLDFSGCDFTGAELSRCNFQNAICAQAVFDKATLFQTTLDGAECLSASFQHANLTECSAKKLGSVAAM